MFYPISIDYTRRFRSIIPVLSRCEEWQFALISVWFCICDPNSSTWLNTHNVSMVWGADVVHIESFIQTNCAPSGSGFKIKIFFFKIQLPQFAATPKKDQPQTLPQVRYRIPSNFHIPFSSWVEFDSRVWKSRKIVWKKFEVKLI